MARLSHAAAAAELARRDPVLAELVAYAGPPRLRAPRDSHFASLVRSVTFQQLAGSAATAIHARLVAALGGQVTPEAVMATPEDALRGAGLSASKAACVRDLAGKVADGTVVLEDRSISRLSDDDVTARLCAVRGIGRWTAEMFLLFQLRRLDVWPTGDLGVRRGYALAWGVPTPVPAKLQELGEAFRPFRSVAAWYCWRAVDRDRHRPDAPGIT